MCEGRTAPWWSHQPTLEQGSHLIDSWQQIISQLNGRANHPVIVAQSLQTAVTPPIISLNSSPRLNGFTHRWLQAGSGSIINSCEANSANLSSISLSSDQNQCFASSPRPRLPECGAPMKVSSTSTVQPDDLDPAAPLLAATYATSPSVR